MPNQTSSACRRPSLPMRPSPRCLRHPRLRDGPSWRWTMERCGYRQPGGHVGREGGHGIDPTMIRGAG